MSRTNKILRNEEIQVKGKVSFKTSSHGNYMNISDRLFKEKEEIENKILLAKKEYERIISQMEEYKKAILDEATVKSKDIEKKAYELGYEQGMKNGYEDGYKESYEENIERALQESEKIKEESYDTLLNIKNQTINYIKESKENIFKIAIAIAEQVLREKLEHTDSMNNILRNILTEYNLKNDLIIKVNPIYKEELEKSINEMINELNLSQKIFIVPDYSIREGNVEIKTSSGKLALGIDSVLDKVKSELL